MFVHVRYVSARVCSCPLVSAERSEEAEALFAATVGALERVAGPRAEGTLAAAAALAAHYSAHGACSCALALALLHVLDIPLPRRVAAC